jgi:hypothetical protein
MTRFCFVLTSAFALCACADFSLKSQAGAILAIAVDPPSVRKDVELKITVQTAAIPTAPEVRLLGRLLPLVSDPADARSIFVYRYTATGAEPEGVDLAVDVSGGSATRSASVRFDFTPPQLFNITALPRSIGVGETAQLDLEMSEPLATAPEVTYQNRSLPCSPDARLGDQEWHCTLTPLATDPPGWQVATFALADKAGNATRNADRALGAVFNLGQSLSLTSPGLVPARAGRLMQVLIPVQTNLYLGEEPTVTMGERTATPSPPTATLVDGPSASGRFLFAYTVRGTELGPDPLEKEVPVMANAGGASFPLGMLDLDFLPPSLVPPVTASDAHVPTQKAVTVTVKSDEALATLAATVQGQPLDCKVDPADAATWGCSYTAVGTEQEGRVQLLLVMTDFFGNSSKSLADAGFSFDFRCKVHPEHVFVVGRWDEDWTFLAEPGAFDAGSSVDVLAAASGAPILTGLVAGDDGSVAPATLAGAPRDVLPVLSVLAKNPAVAKKCAPVPARARHTATLTALPAGADVGVIPKAWSWKGGVRTPGLRDLLDTDLATSLVALSKLDGQEHAVAAPAIPANLDWTRVSSLGTPPASVGDIPLAYVPGLGAVRYDPVPSTTPVSIWDGHFWSRWNTPENSPYPTVALAFGFAYDAPRDALLLFGGTDTSSGAISRDAWAGHLDRARAECLWSAAAALSLPRDRAWPTMALDRARGEVLLFGGYTEVNLDPVFLDDTWTWDGQLWHARVPAAIPQARSAPALAYDSTRQRTVLFGGFTTHSYVDGFGGALGDTWEWTGTDWSKRATTGPAPRGAASMAWHPMLGASLLVGGTSSDGTLLSDTWKWDGTAWSLLQTATPLPPSGSAGMAYDERRGRMVLYRYEPPVAVDVWELTESGKVPGLVSQLVAFDTGRRPVTLRLKAVAHATAPASAPTTMDLSLWDAELAIWVKLASADGTSLEATVAGDDIARFLPARTLRALVAGPPSSTAGASSLMVDYIEAQIDW